MVIPFYGSSDAEMFAIERSAMDRQGKVIGALDRIMPETGRMLDVGAGNGFTAARLTTSGRDVVALEPSEGMVDSSVDVTWVRGIAQGLPFEDACFDGAYSTWAYFFPGLHDISAGLEEIDRVTRGPVAIVDNAGDDEFMAMADHPSVTDFGFWRREGFHISIIETAFEFESIDEASRLLQFYFGDGARPALQVEYRVALMVK